ncbi:hypothetical protein MNBD_GAMMA12-1193 [hydrothermal vent metagenome]|uniref:Uncharacterized protein n=1 Tax=hydrothermal vent metagenome TaxID=652676 RepID=A0A3B0YVK4_9ZZZZ
MIVFTPRVLLIVFSLVIASPGFGLDILFEKDKFKPIKFGSVTPTEYQFSKNQLKAVVNGSASALILPFAKPLLIKKISFKWKAKGKLKLGTAQLEASKQGDDNYYRLGLMVSGKAPFVPFFAPAWVKLTRQHLKQPSNGMQVYFVNAQHAPGKTWLSPYSSSIKNFSVAGVKVDDGYQEVTINLKQAVSTAGLWLASDGDDTQSNFVVWVKDLKIE